MPLSSNPSRDDIWNQFGNNSKPSANALNEMSNRIFGSGLYSRDAFGGTGRPALIQTQPATSIGTSSATLNVEIGSVGGLTCTVYFQIDTDPNFGSPSTTSTDTATSDNETVSIQATGLSSGTTYYFRAVVYNEYINDPADYMVDALNEESFTTTVQCNSPSNAQAIGPFMPGDVFQISWDAASPAPSNDYRVQYEKNGSGNWFLVGDQVTSPVNFNGCDFGNTGDTFRFRVASNCGGGVYSSHAFTSTTDSISGC